MAKQDKSKGESIVIQVPAVADMTASALFLADAKKSSDGKSDVVFDASVVEKITTPCLQIIISTAVSQKNYSKAIKIQNPSAAFLSAVEDLGFSNQLNEWKE